MKKFYEINIAHRGKVETHTFKTKKEKNTWLVKYLTWGNGGVWGRRQYEKYVEETQKQNKKILSFEKYILSLIKNVERLTIRSRNEIIIIREKIFEKIRKNA